MMRIDAADKGVKPAYTADAGGQNFVGGPPGTVVSHEWLNHVQEELCEIVETIGGGALNKADDNQIWPILWHVRGLRATTADDTGLTTPDLRVVMAATTCDVGGDRSAVVASINSDCVTGGAAANRFIAGSFTSTIANNCADAAVLASSNSALTGVLCAFMAGTSTSAVSGSYAAAMATTGSTASGNTSAVAASANVEAAGAGSAVIGGSGETTAADCKTSGSASAIIACYGSTATKNLIAAGTSGCSTISSYDAHINSGNFHSIIASTTNCTASGAGSEGCLVAASSGSDINSVGGSALAILACTLGTITSTGRGNLIAACDSTGLGAWPTTTGTAASTATIACEKNVVMSSANMAAAIACEGTISMQGQQVAIIACDDGAGAVGPIISGIKAAAICSDGDFTNAASNCLLVASSIGAGAAALALGAGDNNSVVFGAVTAPAGGADATYRTMRQHAVVTGGDSILADGAFNGGGAGLDYAEYFEHAELGSLPVGSVISQVGGRAKLAEPGERVLGIVSAKPAFIAGSSGLHWHGLTKIDEFGAEQRDEAGLALLSDSVDLERLKDYVPRSQRPEEWSCVALMGQLRVRVDATVQPGSYVVPSSTPGVGTHADEPPRTGRPVECMRIVAKPSKKRGCGIALCLVG